MKQPSQHRFGIILLLYVLLALGGVYFAYKHFSELNISENNRLSSGLRAGQPAEFKNLQGEISRFFYGIKRSEWASKSNKKAVVPIELGDKTLLQQIDTIAASTDQPLPADWESQIVSHWFMEDSTLKENLSRMATENGLQLLWWLEKDFKVQAAFKVRADLLTTAERLALSLDSHFMFGPHAYICPQLRLLLIASDDEAARTRRYCTLATEFLAK